MLSVLFTLAVFVSALFIDYESFNILETLIILNVWHGCMDGCGVTKSLLLCHSHHSAVVLSTICNLWPQFSCSCSHSVYILILQFREYFLFLFICLFT